VHLSLKLWQHVLLLQASARLAEAAPPSGAERRRFYSRTTTEALKEARQHQRKGAHPYRVVLGEVRRDRQAVCLHTCSSAILYIVAGKRAPHGCTASLHAQD
jgi:hypothetical protein